MKSLEIKQTITTRDSRALKAYFNELKDIKILSHDEEYELAYAAHNGDENARQTLVKHNLRFVISVAKQYETPFLPLEDLINEGNYGLVVASSKFDPSRGFKFLSYAVYWIRRYILSYIADNGKTIRLPNNKINLITKIKDAVSHLEQKLQRFPSFDELVDSLEGQFSNEEVSFYYDTISSKIMSLDMEVGYEGSTTALVNLIKDGNTMETTHFVDITDSQIRKNKLLNILDKDVERKVINLLYGLDGQSPVPLKTIGFLLGLTSERVRQIKEKSLKKLKLNLVS